MGVVVEGPCRFAHPFVRWDYGPLSCANCALHVILQTPRFNLPPRYRRSFRRQNMPLVVENRVGGDDPCIIRTNPNHCGTCYDPNWNHPFV